jgi:lysophospholipase L1-like esterase
MNILLTAALMLVLLMIADAAIRAALLLDLRKKIGAKGDYIQRDHLLGQSTPYTITLIGASSIYGEGTKVEIPFASTLAHRLARQGYRVTVHNLAVSGHKVADVVSRQVPNIQPSDLVIVYAGTKDCLTLTPIQQYTDRVKQLAKALEGKRVVWVTLGDPRLLWAFPFWLRLLFYRRARRFASLLKQVVSEHPSEHWQVADFFAYSIARRQGLNARQLVSDGIHLSDKGQELVSQLVDSVVG